MTTERQILHDLLDAAVDEHGAERILRALESLIVDSRTNVLTIIANAGRHNIPQEYLRGDIFLASSGNLDLSSRSSAENAIFEILSNLNRKLLEHSWSKIYLIPTGHPILSLQIKTTVYRVTRLNTIDLFYLDGKYFDLAIDLRNIDERHKT